MFHAGFNMVGCSPDPDTVVDFDTAEEAVTYLADLITALWDERYEQCENGSDRLAVDGEMLDAHTEIHNAPTPPLTIIITEQWNRIAPLQWAYWITEDQPSILCPECGEILPEHVNEFDAGCSCPRCDHCNRTQESTPELEWNGDTGCHVGCEHLMAAFTTAKSKHDTLVARYNKEYREGKWSTNRELASKCEDAYSEVVWAVNFCRAQGIDVEMPS
jgi:hypothetical protein